MKNTAISVSLKREELDAVKKIAAENGVTISKLVATLIREALQKPQLLEVVTSTFRSNATNRIRELEKQKIKHDEAERRLLARKANIEKQIRALAKIRL